MLIVAFYLLIDFSAFAERLRERGIERDSELTERLLEETGVALLPGSNFGIGAGALTARLSYVDFDGALALAEAELVPRDRQLDDAFLERCCQNVIAAVERICGWIAGP